MRDTLLPAATGGLAGSGAEQNGRIGGDLGELDRAGAGDGGGRESRETEAKGSSSAESDQRLAHFDFTRFPSCLLDVTFFGVSA